jgi:hypothetical protein
MTTKYTKIFRSKAFKNVTKLGFFGLQIYYLAIWQACFRATFDGARSASWSDRPDRVKFQHLGKIIPN